MVEAPDQEYRGPILELLAHKGGDWERHMEAALGGATDALDTRWSLAIMDGRPVANAMVVERHGVGILGHVFTRPECRRLGVARSVLSSLLDDFGRRGGRSLLLGTGFESVAYHLYASLGFESIRRGFMGWYSATRARFEADWFGAGSAEVREARWEHWPLTAALASFAGVARPASSTPDLRSVAWGVQDIGNLESPYCHFMASGVPSGSRGAVAQTEQGSVVACATCTPFRVGDGSEPWAGVWLVDAFAHPLHIYKLGDTLGSLPIPAGQAVAFVPAEDEMRRAVFAQAGFAREGRLPNALRPTGAAAAETAQTGDVLIYSKQTHGDVNSNDWG
ncbi:MAG: GNAT family N-acetyltransferase [Armatimonadetes bacterium]|nr:GNAT family N-acetyltransferase [Armatimonadota bacterium]